MRALEYDLYRFLSNFKRLFSRSLMFYRPATIIGPLIYITGAYRVYLYAMGTFYASFISLIFAIYRLPGRLSKDLNGPALLELVAVKRSELFIARVLSTYILASFLSLFPILAIFSFTIPILGYRSVLYALLMDLSSNLFALSSASIGLLFVPKRSPTFTLTVSYATLITATAVPFVLFSTFRSPVYLLPLILSPGFTPSMAVLYVSSRLGLGVTNDVRQIYASWSGKNPYYPPLYLSVLPCLIYLIISLIVFRLRFRNADL